jgi:hypothetical protein
MEGELHAGIGVKGTQLVVQKKGCKGQKDEDGNPLCNKDGFLWDWGDPLCTWKDEFTQNGRYRGLPSIRGSTDTKNQKLVNVTGENHGKIEFVTAAVAEDHKDKAINLMDCGIQQMLKSTDVCKGQSTTSGTRHINDVTGAISRSNTCKLATCTLRDQFKRKTGKAWRDAAIRKKVASCYISFQLNAGIDIAKVFDPENTLDDRRGMKLTKSAKPLNKITEGDRERMKHIEPKVLRAAVALIRDDYYHLLHETDGPCTVEPCCSDPEIDWEKQTWKKQPFDGHCNGPYGSWEGLKKDWNLLPKVNWDMRTKFVQLVNHVYGVVFPGDYNPFWTKPCATSPRQCIYSWRGESSAIPLFRNSNGRVLGVFEFRHPNNNPLFNGIPKKNPKDYGRDQKEKEEQLKRFLTDAANLALP